MSEDACIVDGCEARRNGPGGGPGSPCQGQGMSQQSRIDAYGQKVAQLQKDWPALAPAQRTARMQSLVDGQALANGFPAPQVQIEAGGANDGTFRRRDWTIAINQNEVSSPTLSPDQAKELGDTIYHETRHAEQSFLMARQQAQLGKTADQITSQMNIPRNVATPATRVPLPPDSPQAPCASALYASTFGDGKDHRITTMTNLSTQGEAKDAARKAWETASAAKDALPATATAAQRYAATQTSGTLAQRYLDACHAYDATYADYRALPAEADAWNAGGRAGDAVAQALGGH